MERFPGRLVVAVPLGVALSLLAVASVAAQGEPRVARVRPGRSCQPNLTAAAAARSPTFRALLDTLAQSDVIVFVRCVALEQSGQGGRMRYIGSGRDWRFVLVEIGVPQPWSVQVATLAHELQHAVELAQAPWVRTPEAVADHYRTIGFVTDAAPLTFDTDAARSIGVRVHREVFGFESPFVTAAGARP